jgi:hypothetical protein
MLPAETGSRREGKAFGAQRFPVCLQLSLGKEMNSPTRCITLAKDLNEEKTESRFASSAFKPP